MINPRRILTAGGTFACALGVGFIMQNAASSEPVATEVSMGGMIATAPVQVVEDSFTQVSKGSGQIPEQEFTGKLTGITLTSASIPTPPKMGPQPKRLPTSPVDGAQIAKAALTDQPILKLPPEEPAPAFSCEITMSAKALAAAMAEVTVNAPCLVNERFTLHHSGMMFTEVTDSKGNSRMIVPGLSPNAVFMASFPNGEAAMASVSLDALEFYERAVIQWQGDSGLQLHALEYGAGYDDPGHVWADAAGDFEQMAMGDRGVLTRLGAKDVPNARLAEVYTFPSGAAQKPGDIHLSVEAEITSANCGRDITAQSLEVRKGGTLRARDLELAMPACDATGDFLVLKNMLNDLKIART